MTDNEPTELLTIADAAERLGVTEKRLRFFLSRPENKVHLQTGEQQTLRGMRKVQMMPFPFPTTDDWLERERVRVPRVSLIDRADADWEETAYLANRVKTFGGHDEAENDEEDLPIVCYLSVIAELKKRIKDLKDALKAERKQSRILAEALAREQAMLQNVAEAKLRL